MRLQAANRIPQTGALLAGEVIFEPGPVRVTALQVSLGGTLQPGAPVLTVTSVKHVVTISLEAVRQAIVRAGDPVSILLPDGVTTADGHLASIAKVAEQPQNVNQNGPLPSPRPSPPR